MGRAFSKKGNAHKISVSKTIGKHISCYKLSRWEDITKADVKEVECQDVKLIHAELKTFSSAHRYLCFSVLQTNKGTTYIYIYIYIYTDWPKKCIHSLLINIFGIKLNEISISG